MNYFTVTKEREQDNYLIFCKQLQRALADIQRDIYEYNALHYDKFSKQHKRDITNLADSISCMRTYADKFVRHAESLQDK